MNNTNILYSKIKKELEIDEQNDEKGIIYAISGPVVVGKNMFGCMMYEIVKVGKNKLIGEIIKIENESATIQVFEDTTGLSLNDTIERTYKPLSIELGPGMFENIYDGIQRPLSMIRKASNSIYIPKGVSINCLDRNKRYNFGPCVKKGDIISKGGIIGFVQENSLMKVKITIHPDLYGKVISIIEPGEYTIDTVIAEIKTDEEIEKVKMFHSWPVRKPRPIKEKLQLKEQLTTGQRILDSFFPMAQGGTVAIPGGFGCGKTVISQSVSKYSNSDVVVYVGCGERGNEMSEVLMEFPKLMIKNTKECIMKRTILIANTSNMPVAAREASIYTGITISEYYRDQGFNVSLLADSTSRWAEALREISGRLGEMPADSGYPAYLSARLASFYERAGNFLNNNGTRGTISIIGAVSPPGGDFSDPVTTATLNIVQVFWGLDKKLAQRKHFPSVNTELSYSKYFEKLNFPETFKRDILLLKEIINHCIKIEDIIQLVGRNNLSENEKLILDISKIIRGDFLQQNGYSHYDNYCPIQKTSSMASLITLYYKKALKLLNSMTWDECKNKTKNSFYALSQLKFIVSDDNFKENFQSIKESIELELNKVSQ